MTKISSHWPRLCLTLVVGSGLGCEMGYDNATAINANQSAEPIQWHLPKALREASGLATLNSREVLAIQDESAKLYVLNVETGNEEQQVRLAQPTIKGDFEGVALSAGTVYLITSSGQLLAADLSNNVASTIQSYQVATPAKCEIEGLAAEPNTDLLWFVCKEYRGEHEKPPALHLYAWSMSNQQLATTRTLHLPLGKGVKKFAASGLSFNPAGSELVVVAARQASIAWIDWTTTPQIRRIAKLPEEPQHRQTEGITHLPNGDLVLADEGGRKSARLTRYPKRYWDH